jgi:hypothetical protein
MYSAKVIIAASDAHIASAGAVAKTGRSAKTNQDNTDASG